MKSVIKRTSDGLRIEAAVSSDKQAALLDELGKCAAGTCSCPTPQYEKLSGINVEPTADGVIVDLKVKDGQQVDVNDLQKCLDHTAKQVGA